MSIEHARATWPGVRFVEARFEDLDESELGRFDMVVCSEVYEHVEHPRALLATIHRLLRPGGYLSFSTPSGWMWRRPSVVNLYRFATDPSGYLRRLRPQRDWPQALPTHPASRPQVAQDHLEEAGLQVVFRASSCWTLESEDCSVVYRGLGRLARSRPLLASRIFFYGWMAAEALLNLAPPLRVFESRLVLVARRT